MTERNTAALKDRLLAGDVLVGTFLQTPHPAVAEFAAGLGFDFLCLEGEHSAMDLATVQNLVRAGNAGGAPMLVRVAQNEWVHIAAALDAGAEGVICPRVNDGVEARSLVSACRYPPAGDRGIGPGRATGYGPDSGEQYRVAANRRIVVGAQVETRGAVERLDSILAVDGLDLVFVGPADLSSCLGLPPGSPGLDQTIRGILEKTRAAGKVAGIWAGSDTLAVQWMDSGAQLVLLASDLIFLARGAMRELEAVKTRAEKGKVDGYDPR